MARSPRPGWWKGHPNFFIHSSGQWSYLFDRKQGDGTMKICVFCLLSKSCGRARPNSGRSETVFRRGNHVGAGPGDASCHGLASFGPQTGYPLDSVAKDKPL